MDVQQLRIRVLARASEFDQEALIPIFHRWIRESRLGDPLLIDVADYRHVPDGPGIMIVGDQAHYALDTSGGLIGLSYSRKRDPIGPVRPKLSEAFAAILTACDALDREPTVAGQLGFDAGRLELSVMSRLVAGNDEAGFAALRPSVAEFLSELYPGSEPTIEQIPGAKRPLALRITVAGEHTPAAVLARVPA
ncbi:MAG: hypothetical protein AAGC55_16095 [Myxococcota bacterium]